MKQFCKLPVIFSFFKKKSPSFPFFILPSIGILLLFQIDLKKRYFSLNHLLFILGISFLVVFMLKVRKKKTPTYPSDNEEPFLYKELEIKQQEIDKLKNFIINKERKTEDQLAYIQNNLIRIQNENHNLKIKLHQTNEDFQKREIIIKFLRKEIKDSQNNYQNHIEDLKKDYENSKVLCKEYQKTIQEQREIINQKSSYSVKLENKIKDLIFEIRNLLHLEDRDKNHISSHQVKGKCSTIQKLNLLTEKAENLASDQIKDFITKSSFSVPPNRYSLEFREFFDKLRNETSFILFIYSLKEKNFVFTNGMFKQWIGLSPNILLQRKEEFLAKYGNNWIRDLECTENSETLGKVAIKTSTKGVIDFNYYNQKIIKGPLEKHTIGILSPFEK